MKISVRILAIAIIILTATSTYAVSIPGQVTALKTGSVRVHPIANPPYIQLDSSFNPASVFNPAVTPVGGAPFCFTHSRGTLICYPPSFLRKAMDFPTNPAINGAGQTIVIVDAFGSPTLAADVNAYDTAFSVPAMTVVKLCPPTFTGSASDVCPDANISNFVSPTPGSAYDVCGALGWAEETTLDVTQAHALAPGAKIVLVEAASCFDVDLNAAEMAVVTQPSLAGSIMSQSFGEPDDLVGCNFLPCNNTTPGVFDPTIRSNYDKIAQIAANNSWTVLASSGDDGANTGFSAFGLPELTPSFPATNPLTLGVGGSQGLPYGGDSGGPFPPSAHGYTLGVNGTKSCAAGATCNTGLLIVNGGTKGCQTAARPALPTGCTPTGYGGEGAWQEYNFFGVRTSTGGGFSNNYYLNTETAGNFSFEHTYASPSYQSSLAASYALTNGTLVPRVGRATPDVAFNAQANGGVLNYLTFLGAWVIFSGTSAASPAWAAIIALVNQVHGAPSGFINTAIYNLANSGLYSDAFHDITVGNNTNAPGFSQNGFVAGTGWDPTTGWGTPDVAHFINDIQFFILSPSATSYGLTLEHGWNIISVPLVPQATPIGTVLGALATGNEISVVWSYQGGKWLFATQKNGKFSGPLTTVQDGFGYAMYVTAPTGDNLYVNGFVIVPNMAPPSYSLGAGWNLVGFKPQPTVGTEQTGNYLTSLGSSYDTAHVYIFDNPSGTWQSATGTTLIQVGQALWVYMKSANTLTP